MENQNGNEEIILPTSRPGIFTQFYRDTLLVLTEPVRFYQTRFTQMSFNYAVGFGLAVSWIAAFLDWVMRTVKHETLMDGFVKMKQQLQGLPVWKNLPSDIWAQGEQATSSFPAWGLEGLRMLLTPFYSIFGFVISGLIFFLGANLLVSKDNPAKKLVTMNNTVKLVAVASVSSIIGSILGFLPIGLGALVGWIYHTALLTIGFSETFRISKMRGLGIVFLPTFALFLVFSCILGLIVTVFAGLFASLFHGSL